MYDLQTILNDYLSYCTFQKKLSNKTLKAYAIDLKQFLSFSSDVSNPFERTHLTAYIRFLNQRYKPKTAKRKAAVLKAFCSYLVYEDILELHPFSKIRTGFREPVLLTSRFSQTRILFPCSKKAKTTELFHPAVFALHHNHFIFFTSPARLPNYLKSAKAVMIHLHRRFKTAALYKYGSTITLRRPILSFTLGICATT